MLDVPHGDRRRVTCDPQRSDGHPAFAPDGKTLAFDGDDRADEARDIDTHVLDLRTGALTCLSDGTVAIRRPVWIDRRWLLAERRGVTGPTLVLLDRLKKRVLPIGERAGGEREPSLWLGGKRKRLQVAFVRRDETADRDAVWLAELRGVKFEGAEPEEPPAPATEDAADTEHKSS
jgi:hypothetical protein